MAREERIDADAVNDIFRRMEQEAIEGRTPLQLAWRLQRGALLAKGRLLGAQFAALFEDGLYFDVARHANTTAAMLADGLRSVGTRFLSEPVTNQVFPILADTQIAALRPLYAFHVWSRVDPAHSAIRLVTSWATQPQAVHGFLDDFARMAAGRPVSGSRAAPVIGM